jgi:DNA helicase II / ATP-dependent DNA helicase PcrA
MSHPSDLSDHHNSNPVADEPNPFEHDVRSEGGRWVPNEEPEFSGFEGMPGEPMPGEPMEETFPAARSPKKRTSKNEAVRAGTSPGQSSQTGTTRSALSAGAAALLDGLNDQQRAAVESTAAPLCILAGAGSGKTRVLTRRIAYRIEEGTADATHTLALTFTRKAAEELTKRLGQLGVRERVAAGTFHAIAYAQLRQWWADTGQRAPQLTESKMRLVAPLLGAKRAVVAPIDIVSEIEWAKARLLTPDTYGLAVEELGRKPPLGVGEMAEIYRRYEADKKRKGIVDFDDLLVLCVRALETDREFGARQRWRFRHLFVDEFQDVNPAQHRLLEGWLGLGDFGVIGANDPIDLCVVGDPNQAIYAWNGADPAFLTEFRTRHANAQVVRLEDNYRSTPEILTVADAVLGPGPRDTRPLTPNRPSGPVPTVQSYASDLEEAKAVARAVRDRHSSKTPWKHMAVLTRTNAQGLLFEEAFRAAGIPHKVRGGGTFLNQTGVKEALAELRRLPGNLPFSARLSDLEELAEEANRTGTVGPEGVNERASQFEGLVRLGVEFLGADPTGDTTSFLQWLNGVITSRNDEPDRNTNVVEIATFHRSKGLEWPVVFLTGLERGFVPIGQAADQDGWDEERRLLYVAVTRAERELHCSWAKTRTFGSRTTNRNESPWLSNIEAARQSLEQPGSGDWRAILKVNRERLAAAKAAGVPGVRGTKRASIGLGTNADPAVFEALKKWRAETARQTGVPAFVICHDTTLAAVAEADPADREQLRSIAGFGQVKVDRYGERLLAVLRECKAS